MNWIAITFVVYTIMCFALAIIAGRRHTSNIRDFFVGGRRVGIVGTAFSYMASARSASSMLGDSGLAYLMGYPTIFLGIGMTAVEFLNMLYTGPRLRKYVERYDCITIPDYLEERFEDRRMHLRGLSCLVIVVFFVAYIAAQWVGVSLAFTTMFKWDAVTGMILGTAIVTIYCAIGGYVAVVWTDIFQGILMCLAFLILPIAMIIQAGGVGEIFTKLATIDPKLAVPFGQGIQHFLLVIFLAVGSLGNPHIIIRFMSAGSSDVLRKAAYGSLVTNIIMRWGAIFTGLAGRALWPDPSHLLAGNREMVFFTGGVNLLPPIIAGLLVAAVAAAVMSTVDSQQMVLSSAIVRDFYGRYLGKEKSLTEARYVQISRWSVLITGILALLFAIYAKAGVFVIVSFAWGGLGSAFGPVVILSLFWKRMTRAGAIAGMLCGFLVTIIWRLTPALKVIVYEAVPAVFIAIGAIIVVSLMTSPPAAPRVEADFEAMRPRYKHATAKAQ